jgi:type I restriction-modification system DNA methylase subunit
MESQMKNTAPAIIHKLVEIFEKNLDSYGSNKNETELRVDFLNPFFTALGWDVSNEKGYDEAHKEVIHEYSVEVAGQGKRADYAFRTGADKFDFLVEAKKPSVKVETSQDAAFQIRRYGWSAKLPINILTDFEHLAIYDCRVKPSYNDKASFGRILLIHYKEYVERWDEIVEIFSPEAVRQGSFAKYADSMKGKKGTADVDDAFLQEIERWRELLAKNIALRNEDIDIAGLNYAVQMTIDRIVFLRISEERGIEPENQLQDIANSDGVYQELCELFKRADTKYNSGLFHFKKEKELVSRPDDLSLSLDIDDKVLKDIISNLYYPKSPYAFLYIPSDILGQVYERFLGKVIRLTDGHQARVEEKPEVRKAGGVYYTPTYIVDYIVKNTVGKFVENKTPKDIVPLKLVDPACGSGSFLLGAYQFLLDWHLNWFAENNPEKWEKNNSIVKIGNGYRLSTAKKKEILLNNIHGVDVDAQAVEVTKLSLLLKVLENASGQLGLGMERVLPDLGNNIKYGNSLIGSDYSEGELGNVNPFDWHIGFKDVFAKGGFDAVIGNPPYINIENIPEASKNYFRLSYGEDGKLGKRYDIYQVFVLQGINLLKDSGLMGFILPNTFLMGHSYLTMRKRIAETTKIVQCVDLPQGVFHGVTVDNVLLFLCKEPDSKKRISNVLHIKKLDSKSDKSRVSSENWDEIFDIPQNVLSSESEYKINVHANPVQSILFNKIESSSVRLGEITESSQGIILYKTAEDAEQAKYTGFGKKAGWKKLLRGRNIGRYEVKWADEYVNYGDWLWCARDEKYFATPKILLQAMRNKALARRLIGTYDDDNYYNAHNLANIIAKQDLPYNLKYILGLFNSNLLNFWYKAHFPNVNINPNDFRQLPICAINFSISHQKAQHDKIVSLVEQMLASHKSLATAKSPQEKERIENQIKNTDKAIDSLVYELYGLNQKEIKIVEDSLLKA